MQSQVLWVIIRKTWGQEDPEHPNQRKEMAVVPISQFVKATKPLDGKPGPNTGAISLALQNLLLKKAILKKETLAGLSYGVQTDYDKWIPLPKKQRGIRKGKPPPPKKRKAKKPANPDVKIFLDWWITAYQEECNSKYHVDYNKDGALVKGLLRTFSLDELQARATMFLQSTDEWIIATGKTIGIFKMKVNSFSLENKQSEIQW